MVLRIVWEIFICCFVFIEFAGFFIKGNLIVEIIVLIFIVLGDRESIGLLLIGDKFFDLLVVLCFLFFFLGVSGGVDF